MESVVVAAHAEAPVLGVQRIELTGDQRTTKAKLWGSRAIDSLANAPLLAANASRQPGISPCNDHLCLTLTGCFYTTQRANFPEDIFRAANLFPPIQRSP